MNRCVKKPFLVIANLVTYITLVLDNNYNSLLENLWQGTTEGMEMQ